MSKDIPTSPADLEGMECIAAVSSRTASKHVWTDLAIWYRRGNPRPFVTVIEGKVAAGAPGHMVPRFRAVTSGTLQRALGVLEDSDLAMELVQDVPEGAETQFPDSDFVRMQEAEERRATRFYGGVSSLSAALAWLYPELEAPSDNQLADRFEKDFGIGSRTSRGILAGERAGKEAPTWVGAFIEALRWFDRKAWGMRT